MPVFVGMIWRRLTARSLTEPDAALTSLLVQARTATADEAVDERDPFAETESIAS
jgi:hypothetical protein